MRLASVAMLFLSIAFAAVVGNVAHEQDVCVGSSCEEMSVLQSKIVKRHRQSSKTVRKRSPEGEGEHIVETPYDIMKCEKAPEPPLTTEHMNPEDYDAIIDSFREAFDGLDQACEGEYCPVADVAGCILRMAGHDFMDYANGTGGSDACTDMNEADNAGLRDCLSTGSEGATIKQVYNHYCDKVSLADFVVIAAEAAMTYTRHIYLNKTSPERGEVDFRSQFQYGRTTGKTCSENQELPNPSKSCRDVERVFIQNMGLDWRHAAALMGVHTLGRASVHNSGFNGWWSDAKNSRRFNNNYFVSLYLKGWIPQKVKETGKWQWGYSDLNRNDEVDGIQMMLDSDICLAYSDIFNTIGYKEILAESRPHTCAWTLPNLSYEPDRKNRPGVGQYPLIDAIEKYNDNKFCGVNMTEAWKDLPGGEGLDDRMAQWRPDAWYTQKHGIRAMDVFTEIRIACCNGCGNFGDNPRGRKCNDALKADGFPKVAKDTGVVSHPSGRAKMHVMEFANDEFAWISAFLEAWKVATTNGQADNLKPLVTDAPAPPPAVVELKCDGFCQDYALCKGSEWCEDSACGACAECEVECASEPPTFLPTPEPADDPQCLDTCDGDDSADWDTKCTWANQCDGCSQCMP